LHVSSFYLIEGWIICINKTHHCIHPASSLAIKHSFYQPNFYISVHSHRNGSLSFRRQSFRRVHFVAFIS